MGDLQEARERSRRGAPQRTAEMKTQLRELMKSDRTVPENVDGGEKRKQDCQQRREQHEGEKEVFTRWLICTFTSKTPDKVS